MNRSEKVAALFAALSKAQGEMPNPKKDTSGYGYNYADLAGCIVAAKDVMAKHGLVVTQLVGSVDNVTTIETILGHESGEFISTIATVPMAKLEGQSGQNPAQVMGASITYMRRYQFAAIVGMAQQDDDAASAAKGPAQQPTKRQQPQQANDDKPWLNKEQLDPMLNDIQAALDAQKRTPEQVVKNLEESYKINKATRERLLNMQPAPQQQAS